ncbi:unnamed protein product [Diamesa serratosioi]
MFQMYSSMHRRNEEKNQIETETTGHDRFCQERPSRSSYRKNKRKHVRRTQSVAEFTTETRTVSTAANKRHLFRGRSVSSEQDNSESEHSEKSPLVKLDSLAKLLFSRSLSQVNGSQSKENSPTRNTIKFQYTALDSGIGASDRSPRERAARDRAFSACREWLINTGGRYEIISHLDDIGSRTNKHWFLLNDSAIKTDRLMTLLPLPPDCVALEELPNSECPQNILMELLGSLQHPYIYPILDLGFFHTETHHYACLVMPFNSRGSLKDLIYKSQWNEPWNRKYTTKPTCLPISQVQRLGRQILEALLFLRDRGIPSHGHLHSGNVILANGVARLSGLENGLLGLNSRVNAVLWAQSAADIENIDVICFGHLLYEMCTGYELSEPLPTRGHLQLDLERNPQVVEVLQMIFDSPGRYPTLEELVLCDLFRNIDLREMRGTRVPAFKHDLSSSTLSLLNAVRKRHSVMTGSFSEGSSPCTPPSTPRDKHGQHGELSELSSGSELEDNLDEIVISSVDPLSSPIHYCDTNGQSTSAAAAAATTASACRTIDDKSTVIRISSVDERSASTSGNQQQQYQNHHHHTPSQSSSLDPSSAYKNSKVRRSVYASNKLSSSRSSNPSQDSAFGSMTDGELSRASSFKLSSFQSVSSPIDEGVEDVLIEVKNTEKSLSTVTSSFKYIDSSSCSSPCPDNYTQSLNDLNIPGPSHANPMHATNIKETCIYLDPPTLVVNDQFIGNYIYTSSPIRKCATTEIFSQKYRVSSFEDMAHNSNMLRNFANKKPFRSFEEEQRIDSAFKPISCQDIEGNNKLTSKHFSSRTGKERSLLWKDSFLKCNKNNLTIKSNESLYDVESVEEQEIKSYESEKLIAFDERRASIDSNLSLTPDSTSTQNSSRKTRTDRFLFSLAKFKQNAIVDSIAMETLSESTTTNKQLSNSSSSNEESKNDTTITSSTIDDSNSEEECSSLTESLLKSPSHEEVKKFLKSIDSEENSSSCGNGEEKTPLLDGMEMSSISSSTEPD